MSAVIFCVFWWRDCVPAPSFRLGRDMQAEPTRQPPRQKLLPSAKRAFSLLKPCTCKLHGHAFIHWHFHSICFVGTQFQLGAQLQFVALSKSVGGKLTSPHVTFDLVTTPVACIAALNSLGRFQRCAKGALSNHHLCRK